MKDCPLKWPEKSFKENVILFMKKIVGSTLELSAKVLIGQVSIKTYGLKLCFCYLTYRK